MAVLGFGNLGASLAWNLRDGGLDVLVGNVEDAYAERARAEGFRVLDPADAAGAGDLVYLLVPDEVIPELWPGVARNLRPGAALCFASGYALAYGLVEPPAGVDVLLLAPRMLGEEVRLRYLEGDGFLSYVNVEQDATGRGEERLLALARAAGSLTLGALRLSARQEATLDLFVEQSVGAYLGTAFQLAFRLGVEAGLPPEAVVAELYLSGEMSRTIDGMARRGFYESVRGHGVVATYGGLLGTMGIDHESMERHFRDVLEEIRSGGFATRLQEERTNGYPTLTAIEELLSGNDPVTRAERRFREGLAADGGRTAPGPRSATTPGHRPGGTTGAPGEAGATRP